MKSLVAFVEGVARAALAVALGAVVVLALTLLVKFYGMVIEYAWRLW